MNQWILPGMAIVLSVLVVAAFFVSNAKAEIGIKENNALNSQSSCGSKSCTGSCTAEKNCGSASCGAANGGSCNCGK
jgi:hypothetical protein